MHYVYLLKSLRDGEIYIGLTPYLQRCLKLHSTGRVVATAKRRPLEFIYGEVYKDKRDAVRRERMLKYYGQGLRRLKERLGYSLS